MTMRRVLAAALLAALPIAPAAPEAAVDTVPVALTGEVAPGLPGRTFRYLHQISLNGTGEVMFGGLLDSSDPARDQGIWHGLPGALTLVALEGDPAPGAPGRTFKEFYLNDGNSETNHVNRPQHNDAGQVVFVAYLDGPDPEPGIWTGAPGALQPVAIFGQAAPGLPGGTFRVLSNPLIDEAGNVVFYGVTDTGERGYWHFGPGGLAPLVVPGAPVPGLPGATYRGATSRQDYDLSADGRLAFWAGLTTPVTAGVLVSGAPGALAPVLVTGDPAPDAPGATFRDPASIRVLPGGELLFSADLDPDPLDGGLYRGLPGSLLLIQRDGEPAPEVGVPYSGRAGLADYNSGGEVAFQAILDRTVLPHDVGIYAGAPGSYRLVARTGQEAPGSGGRTFGDYPHATFGAVALNDTGIVALEGDIPPSLDNGLWVGTTAGLEPVAVSGQPFQVRPGDQREVVRAYFVGTQDLYGSGGRNGLNDRDEIGFRLAFEGGSYGLFVGGIEAASNEPPVCDGAEPSPAVLWPPRHGLVALSVLGVTDPDGDEVEIIIEGVTSDEPVAGPGRLHAPDALLGGGDQVSLRAERLGAGNGRVYEIRFTASDGVDSCAGAMQVSVPHDMDGGQAVDDGQLFDATLAPAGGEGGRLERRRLPGGDGRVEPGRRPLPGARPAVPPGIRGES